MSSRAPLAVIIVAAGRGERAGAGRPKQFRPVAGVSLLARSIAAMAAACPQADILCVIGEDDRAAYDQALTELAPDWAGRLLEPVAGGPTRQASVRNGMEALAQAPEPPSYVLIHDAARPFVPPDLVARILAQTEATGAAVPGTPLVDTVKRVAADGRVLDTPVRAELSAVQTPQGFGFAPLLDAHRLAFAAGRDDLTDDAAVAEWAGMVVHVVEGAPENVKITRPEDFEAAERRLSPAPRMRGETRVGLGYDVHAFEPGDAVILGGVAIPHEFALSGHSDADVVLHAITDAVLGAIADGDIGDHFPPSDPQWKGASSDRFLAFAVDRVRARGGRLVHVDATVVCEAPRIGPHRDAMRQSIAAICGLPVGRVAVKATTSERLGFTGRREGVAAQAVATVLLPEEADPTEDA
ncbi:bifunctional 2-C-methyl-D-erythritol 4-phosphate cytidylyltransferase/2-C-methyl-D-erythritol 2,4-cyclodiphosphate synthase [Alsobacter sp. SYSU BS001988]